MVQKTQATTNPAGEPRVVDTGNTDTYTREQFIRDLKTVAAKSPKK